MPAGRYRRYNRKPLRKKTVAKKKVDRKQSRQIRKLQKANYTKVYSIVRVNDTAVGPNSGGAATAYIQPISCALEQSTPSSQQCSDNQSTSLVHERKFLWGANTWAGSPTAPFTGCSAIRTTFCKLQYRIRSTETSMKQVVVAVLQPNRAFADQIVDNRGLMSRFGPGPATTFVNAAPGSQGTLMRDVDYCLAGPVGSATSETIFGCEFNPQMWKVLYKRIHNLQAPNPGANEVGITDTDHAPNDQFGQIKLKMNTYLRAGFSPNEISVDGHTNFATNAQYTDIPREEARYLVVISNDDTSSNPITISTSQEFTHLLYNNNMSAE